MAETNRWGFLEEENDFKQVDTNLPEVKVQLQKPIKTNRWGFLEEEDKSEEKQEPDIVSVQPEFTPDQELAFQLHPNGYEFAKNEYLKREEEPEKIEETDRLTRFQETQEFYSSINQTEEDIKNLSDDDFKNLYGVNKTEAKEEDDERFAKLGTSIAEEVRKSRKSGYESFGLFDYSIIKYVDGKADNTRNFLKVARAIESFSSGSVDQIENTLRGMKKIPVIGNIFYKGIEISMSQFGRVKAAKNEKELANEIAEAIGAGFEFMETTNPVGQSINAIYKAREFAGIQKRINKDAKIKERYLKRSPIQAMLMTREVAEETRKRAKKVASKNTDIAEDLILDAERRLTEQNGGEEVNISKVVDGKLTIDPDKIREVGDLLTRKVATAERTKTTDNIFGTADVALDEFAELVGPDEFASPIVNPDKFNAIVAVASELRDSNPKYFKKGKKRLIDQLYDYTVSGDLKGQDVVDFLDKYGLSFEEYVLTIVGSGSKAGRVLKKLQDIGRKRPASVKRTATEKAVAEAQADWRKNLTRFEGARLGMLVSKLATTARNVTSVLVRSPLEGLANAFDTALYNASTKSTFNGAASLVDPKNWRESFRPMTTIYDGRPDEIKEYTDLILNNPEVSNQYERLLTNLNGIQEAAGRGSGTIADKAFLTPLEDVVSTLNVANRWTEHLIRRAIFFGELQRITKREWDIDLIDTLQKGKVKSLLRDSSEFKPEGARSFIDIIDVSTERALDATFGNAPEIQAFRDISNFISRNGLTVFAEFPRFMFKSMEVMAEYAGGSLIPLTRKIASLINPKLRGPLSERERMLVSRNIAGTVGGSGVALAGLSVLAEDDENPESIRQKVSDALMSVATASAAYLYRSGKFGVPVPAESQFVYTELPSPENPEGVVLDTTSQFPLAQYLYLGDAAAHIDKGTFEEWFDVREFIQKFTGSNFRTGTGNIILDEIAQIADESDMVAAERRGKFAGDLLGNYVGTWLTQLGQIVDLQRALGFRGLEKKDVRPEPTLKGKPAFKNAFRRTMDQMGITTTAEEEEALPMREFLYRDEPKRVNPLARLLLGLTQETGNSPSGEYLRSLGIKQYELEVSKIPSLQRYETRLLREEVPFIAEIGMEEEAYYRDEYKKLTEKEKLNLNESEEQYAKSRTKAYVLRQYKESRKMIRDGVKGEATPYIQELIKYTRFPKDVRKIGAQNFRIKEGRSVFDFKNIENMSGEELLEAKEEDLYILNEYIRDAIEDAKG